MVAWKAAVVLAGASVLGWAGSARAENCQADSDCPRGFSCEVTATGTCPTSPPCESGKACPAPPPCEQTVYRECVPGSCERDSDCAEGMVCHTERSETCSGVAVAPCPPGANCPPVPPPVCETQVRQQCVPRYVLPCASDSDCGAGFDCKAQESCGCASPARPVTPPQPTPVPADAPVDAGSSSGSGAAFAPPSKDGGQLPSPPVDPLPQDAGRPAPSDDGSMPISAPDGGAADGGGPTCVCTPIEDKKSCELQEIACDADADCPASFTCVTLPNSAEPVPACDPPPGADAATCGGFAPPRPAKEIKRCMPPYYGIGGGWGGIGVSRDDGNSEAGGGTPTTAPIPPKAPPQPGGDAGVDEDENAPVHAEACSVRAPGSAPAHDASWLLLLTAAVGLALLKRRRS